MDLGGDIDAKLHRPPETYMILTSVAGSTFNENHQWATARKVSPDRDVHSWALGEVDMLDPAVGEKAIDAGTATESSATGLCLGLNEALAPTANPEKPQQPDVPGPPVFC